MRPDYCPVSNEPCQSLCDTPCSKTMQRQWVGLTKEEFNDAINYKLTPRCIAIAVEAKLKEKNT